MQLKEFLRKPFNVLLVVFSFFIVFAFIVDTPVEIYKGLIRIVKSNDILITDYIEIAGIGATLVNSAVINIFSIFFLKRHNVEATGATIMAFWMLAGFSFFGKNIFNIWPVIFGGWLYAKYINKPFIEYTIVTLLGTTLSPAVSQLCFDKSIPFPFGYILGFSVGIFLGFIMAPISSNSLHSQKGYNLYNLGFAAGIVATVIMTILKAFGIEVRPVFIWNTGNNFILTVFLFCLFFFLIAVGLYCGENNTSNLKSLYRRTGRLASDFYFAYGESVYINMGLLGIFSTLLIILIKGDINGPTMAGIFAVAGYGCFGKHLRNTIPVMIGCLIGAALINFNQDSPSVVIAVLFGTCLAPISGTFGIGWGVVAGFLHINLAMNVGSLHGGLNLYNNGLAGGLVALILVPIIYTFKKKELSYVFDQ